MRGRQLRSTLMKYGITALVGALMVYTTLELHGYARMTGKTERLKLLCDAFTIPGVVLILCGVLVFVSNQGIFEGITYSLSYAIKLLIPGTDKRHERYADYVERKREKGGVKNYRFLPITGAVFLAVALVLMALYYSAS